MVTKLDLLEKLDKMDDNIRDIECAVYRLEKHIELLVAQIERHNLL